MCSFMGKQIHQTTGNPERRGTGPPRANRREGTATSTERGKPDQSRRTTAGKAEGLEVAASEDSARAVDNSSAEEN